MIYLVIDIKNYRDVKEYVENHNYSPESGRMAALQKWRVIKKDPLTLDFIANWVCGMCVASKGDSNVTCDEVNCVGIPFCFKDGVERHFTNEDADAAIAFLEGLGELEG